VVERASEEALGDSELVLRIDEVPFGERTAPRERAERLSPQSPVTA
jgi:hypothetical protein